MIFLEHGATAAASCSIKHDNQTGRWLPVFHACWDLKNPNAFMVGSMTKPRIVEIFEGYNSSGATNSAGNGNSGNGKSGKKGAVKVKAETQDVSDMNACRRVTALGDNGTYLTSVQSRNVFHPYLDVVVCANASGRVHVFD